MNREDFLYHRVWIILILAILVLLVITPFAASRLHGVLDTKIATTTDRRDRLAIQHDQWQKDNKTALDISQSISSQEVRQLLAPADRSALVSQIEAHAAAARLANLRYTVSPPTPWDGGHEFPGIEDIVQSRLLVEADAPHDLDIYAFFEKILKTEGKLRLESLSITRLTDVDESSDPRAHNLRLRAQFLWFGNKERS